jgi:hypothetical protein
MEEEYVQMAPNVPPPKKHRLMTLLVFMSSLIKVTTCLYLRTLQLQEKNLKPIFLIFSDRWRFTMGKCDICGKNGKDLTLLGANHKELGYIKVCSDCWEKLYSKNEFVGGATSSSGSCPTCG